MLRQRKANVLPALFLAAAVALAGCSARSGDSSPKQPAPSSDKAPETVKVDFPKGPIKIIIPRGAGGSTDTVARLLQPYLKDELGQPVVVENVVGAGGVLGNDQVFKAKPDGYTVLFTLTLSDILKQVAEGTPYDMRKFTAVYNVTGGETNVLAVKGDSDVKTFKDLVEKAKAKGVTIGKPRGVNVASIGLALIQDGAKVPKEKLTSVPYDDGKKSAVAAAGGEVDAAIMQPSNVTGLAQEGKVRVLVSFGKKRDPQFPDVPTFQELFPGDSNYYEINNGLLAPPGTPEGIVKVLADAMDKVAKKPDFVAAVNKVSMMGAQGTAEFKADMDRMFKQAETMKPSLRD
jgi:tripartite-type tricarboxylate transporter receptor subunit TctC